MRFATRAVLGLIYALVGAGFIWFGAVALINAMSGKEEQRGRRGEERSYIVALGTFEPTTIIPVSEVFGTVEARRSVDIRAAQGGQVISVADDFQDGSAVKEGAVLAVIDPADQRDQQADRQAVLEDARVRRLDAERSLFRAQAELETASRQLALRVDDLERRQALLQRGLAARVTVDNAELAVQSARQVQIARRQAVDAARTRIDQARLAVERAEIALSTAARNVGETRIIAPFDGILAEPATLSGRLVSTNEKIATLIDPASLEARMSIAGDLYRRLIDSEGALRAQSLRVSLQRGAETIAVRGTLVRVAARAEQSGASVLFARLASGAAQNFRVGDFVRVEIEEPPLQNVAAVPVKAISQDGRILLRRDDGRLEEIRLSVLRRETSRIIVADAPFGRTFVTERLPQLGPGVKVRTAQEAAREAEDKPPRGYGKGGRGH